MRRCGILALAAIAWSAPALADEEVASRDCTATVSINYFQRGHEAQVEMRVDNEYCAASKGSFVIEATTRKDGADDAEKLKFPETWQRDDDATVEMTKRYPIGDNVDLLRIRVRKLTCSCVASAEPAGNP
jgi:hypothetical protein